MKQALTVVIVLLVLGAAVLFGLGNLIWKIMPSHAHITETLDCTQPIDAKNWPGSHAVFGFDFDARMVWVSVVNDHGAPYSGSSLKLTLPQGQTYALEAPLARSQPHSVTISDAEISWIEYPHDGRTAQTLERRSSVLKTQQWWKGKFSGESTVQCRPFVPR